MHGVVTLPNLVSLVRLLLIPVFLWLLFGQDDPGSAGLLLGLIGATDWVDGYLARRLDQVSEIGKLLDPLADRLAVAAAVIGGLIADVLPPAFAWALILREVLIGMGALVGWMRGVAKLDVRYLGKLATFILYFAIAGFYVGVGFDVPLFVTAAWVIGVPGLVIYYVVAFQYVGDMRAAIAAREPNGKPAAR